MNVRRVIATCLMAFSLAGTPALNAAASTWCPKTLQEACSCCHQQQQAQGCQIRCAQPPALSAVSSSTHAAFPRPRTAYASAPVDRLASSSRVASAGTFASDVVHAPPLKRYLLACTFRL